MSTLDALVAMRMALLSDAGFRKRLVQCVAEDLRTEQAAERCTDPTDLSEPGTAERYAERVVRGLGAR